MVIASFSLLFRYMYFCYVVLIYRKQFFFFKLKREQRKITLIIYFTPLAYYEHKRSLIKWSKTHIIIYLYDRTAIYLPDQK